MFADCPVGCSPTNGAFSSRVMWRRYGDLVSYVYHDDKSERCGDDMEWSGELDDGSWHDIRVFIRVNDPGAI